jgi:hypothetical protein
VNVALLQRAQCVNIAFYVAAIALPDRTSS